MAPLNKAAVRFLVVHCAATPPDLDIGVKEITTWHTDPPPKGRGWDGIGYHYVIRRDGMVESGRPITEQGAHVLGHNHEAIGICLVGGVKRVPDADGKPDEDGPQWDLIPDANYTAAQWSTLESLISLLLNRFPGATVCGHRDFSGVTKPCPCFDVKSWWSARTQTEE